MASCAGVQASEIHLTHDGDGPMFSNNMEGGGVNEMIQRVWNICTTPLNQQQNLTESRRRLLSKCCPKTVQSVQFWGVNCSLERCFSFRWQEWEQRVELGTCCCLCLKVWGDLRSRLTYRCPSVTPWPWHFSWFIFTDKIYFIFLSLFFYCFC